MQIGMIGLGRMGAHMVHRLSEGGHEVVAYARHASSVKAVLRPGVAGADSLADLVAKLAQPRVVWLMVPAAAVDATLDQLWPLLAPGDTIVDGGNSFYQDDIRRGQALREHQLHYVDVGTSGGIAGAARGYCLMIGGEAEAVARLAPVFTTLAPGVGTAAATLGRVAGGSADQGYLHCGPHGAGHFVKMVHNGIEYGIMGAFAEGLNILRNANIGTLEHEVDAETSPLRHPEHFQYELNLPDITELWRRGSVISSWLLDLTASALAQDPHLAAYGGRVSDSGEGRWTVEAAIEEGVPAPILSAALFQRFSSRGNSDFGDKVLSAMRAGFGGHVEKPLR
ncbi:MAG: decarboxylating 6-phosphogluconate dehydrogenase [Pseudomonadota bacterium]